MKCPHCQFVNREGRRFCARCGAPVAVVCLSCGFANEPSDEFCGGCGAVLTAATAPAALIAMPEPHTPKHLAEKILTSKTALEGERKQVTVLFADVKGSMELLVGRDPEEAERILHPVIERMIDAVHRYEGIVNLVMGDGIMAIFGAPVAHEDHAVRACYAALWMQERIKQLSPEAEAEHGLPIRVRVGLNSGDVVVRSVRSDLHMDYTAVGQTTHLAARMEQTAEPGSVRLSAETLRLAEGYVVVRPLGAHPIKGVDAPVEIYELVGATGVRSRFQAVAARGLSRFVGRDAELGQLDQASEQARRGHGQIVAIIGDAGVGKSRLFWEFTRAKAAAGWRVIESGTMSFDKATNYLAVTQLLRAYFDIEPDDEPREIRDEVTGRVLALDRQLEPVLPPLLWLLDAPVEDAAWDRLDPPQRRQQTLDGVKRLLLRESQLQPLIVVIEDLHWIDGETQTLLDGLIESLPTAQLLLLVNYRPAYQTAWDSKEFYQQLRIHPLHQQSADELLDALLGGDDGLRPLKQLLIERTEGNPFFLEESVRTLIETKVIAGQQGSYRMATGPVEWQRKIQIPATARALLAARIDQLGEHKRVLEAAAVIGTNVPLALLGAIVDLPEEQLRRSLAAIQAAEFLYEWRLFPDLEYTFKHALTHEVAYGGLLQQRRRVLHARILGAVEQLYPDRLAEQAERLALHAVEGEVWDKAVVYLRHAGARAFAGSAIHDSVAYYKRALAALDRLPVTRDTQTLAIDVRFDLRNALFQLGDIAGGLEQLREAERGARQLNDNRRLGQALASMSSSIWVTGKSLEARELASNALAIGERLAMPSLTVPSGYHLAGALLSLGDYRGAEGALRRVTEALQGDQLYERFDMPGFPGAIAESYLAWGLSELGQFEEGLAHGLKGLQVAETIGQPFSITWACWGLAHLHGVRGDHAEAVALLDRAVDVSQAAGLDVWPTFLGWSRGHMYARLGRLDEGIALIEEALRTREARGIGNWRAQLISHLGEAYVLAGRLDDARETAARAHALAHDLGETGHEAYALYLLADIAAGGDPPDIERAASHYHAAIGSAEALGMRPLLARCRLGLGTLYRRAGDHASAADHLPAAAAMLRDMGMRFWEREVEPVH
jgi:class 3 adenylate cyclase/tetratricopeptide (TPR) repeat protein